MKCATCQGSGRVYSVAYYYGVDECGSCAGLGLDPNTTKCAECGETLQTHMDENFSVCVAEDWIEPDEESDEA